MDFIDRNKIDIMLINETKHTSTIKCKIPGCTCFRRDRPGNVTGGGIAIYGKHDRLLRSRI